MYTSKPLAALGETFQTVLEFIARSLQLPAILPLLVFGYQVQEDEITFYLYKRNVEDLKLSKDNLCNVDSDKDVHFVVHARGVSRNTSFVGESTQIYLRTYDCNVIQVDWSRLAAQPGYIPRDGTSDAGKPSFTIKNDLLTYFSQRLFYCKINSKTAQTPVDSFRAVPSGRTFAGSAGGLFCGEARKKRLERKGQTRDGFGSCQ